MCKSSNLAEIKAFEARALFACLCDLGLVTYHRKWNYPSPEALYVILAMLDYIWDDKSRRWRMGQVSGDKVLPRLEIWPKKHFENTCLVTDNPYYHFPCHDTIIRINVPKTGLPQCVKQFLSEEKGDMPCVRRNKWKVHKRERRFTAQRRAKQTLRVVRNRKMYTVSTIRHGVR